MLALLLLPGCTPEPPAAPAAPAVVTAPPEPPPKPRRKKNRAPAIGTIELGPAAPTIGDSIHVKVSASDPEGEALDLDYAWTVNDVPVLDVANERLPAGRFAKGDQVRVRVSVSDATETVEALSAPLQVANTPPTLHTGPRDVTRLDGFQFKASDADGDPLTWRLENQPPGMSISKRGVLTFRGSAEDPGGSYTVSVFAEDGESYGRFDLPVQVSPGSRAKPD